MRQNSRFFVGMILFTLLVGGGLSGSVIASGDERIDPADLQAITPETLTLQESENGTDWSPIIGNLEDGYSMVLDPANTYEYLDIDTLVAAPVLTDVMHEFYFDAFRAPDGFWEYWAVKGVVEDATGWQGLMWSIINGEQPMFYLEVTASGTEFALVDGLQYQFDETKAPLRVNGDYPLGTYHFGGEVTDVNSDTEYLNIQITFTKQATVSLSSESWTIDGCGYIDVYIHLANVHDLYAVDLELSFDPAFLEVMDLDTARSGDNLEPVNTWFKSDYIVYNDAFNETIDENQAGTIRYVATQQRTAEPVDGEGDIAKIRFRAKAIGSGDIAITSAELSDRDGYLVGREVFLGSRTITTDFTAAGGLDLGIIRYDNANVQLSWPKLAEEEVSEYRLYRSTLPYFDIGDAEVVEMDDTIFVEGTLEITFNDQVLGKVGPADPEIPELDNNYFYAYGLQIACSNDFASPLSDQVGKIEYELFETNTTDFGWIGYTLVSDNIIDYQDLADNIEQNIFSGLIDVLTISRWNPSGQLFSTYDDATGGGNSEIIIEQPYMIEINIDGTSSGSVIYAQVGRLPQPSQDIYTLYETATTDFTWVLQPLALTQITDTTQFAVAIETGSSASISVLTISRWNGTGQTFSSYSRPADSATQFGYPYMIESDIIIGNTVTWP